MIHSFLHLHLGHDRHWNMIKRTRPCNNDNTQSTLQEWKVKKYFLPILSLVYVDERRCPSRVMLILIIIITSKTYTADKYLSFLHRVKYDRIHRTLRTATISPPPQTAKRVIYLFSISLPPCPKRKHRINKKTNHTFLFYFIPIFTSLSLSLSRKTRVSVLPLASWLRTVTRRRRWGCWFWFGFGWLNYHTSHHHHHQHQREREREKRKKGREGREKKEKRKKGKKEKGGGGGGRRRRKGPYYYYYYCCSGYYCYYYSLDYGMLFFCLWMDEWMTKLGFQMLRWG